MPALARCVLALAILSAVGAQLWIHLRAGHSAVNFFSYFTNLSNLLAAALLLATMKRPASWPLARLVVTANMLVVGLVFAVLLRNVDLGALQPWVNTVVHVIAPLALLLDWLLRPPVPAPAWRSLGWLLPIPVLWLGFILLHARTTGWYPYPFLDPAQAGGPAGVALTCVGIGATLLLAGSLLVWTAGWRRSPSNRA